MYVCWTEAPFVEISLDLEKICKNQWLKSTQIGQTLIKTHPTDSSYLGNAPILSQIVLCS